MMSNINKITGIIKLVPSLVKLSARAVPYNQQLHNKCIWTREHKCSKCRLKLCLGYCKNTNQCNAKYKVNDGIISCSLVCFKCGKIGCVNRALCGRCSYYYEYNCIGGLPIEILLYARVYMR